MADNLPAPSTDAAQAYMLTPSLAASVSQAKQDDVFSPEKIKKLVETEEKLTEKKIGAEAAIAADFNRKEKDTRDRMDRLVKEEGISAEGLKPWNAEQEMAKHQTSLWDQFGSPGFLIAMLGSAFTAQPMNSAMQSGGAAIKAMQAGDQAAYERDFQSWKANTDLVIKRQEMQHRAFEDIEHLRNSDITAWRAKMEELLSRFGDQKNLAFLREGLDEKLMQSISTQAQATEQLVQAKEHIVEQKAFADAVQANPKYIEGVKKVAAGDQSGATLIQDAYNEEKTKILSAQYGGKPLSGMGMLWHSAMQLFPNDPVRQADWVAQKQRESKPTNPQQMALAKLLEEHPDATGDQIQEFLRKGKAVRSPQAMALQKYIEEHPDATSEDIAKFSGEYSAIQKADRDFSTGKQGQQINSLNVGISHVETLRELGEALKNHNNRLFNDIAQRWATQTGNPAPTNFETAVKFVGPEIVKALVAGGGGVGERDEMTKAFSRIGSPAQLEGAIDTAERLLSGQYIGLGKQYKDTTKKDDFEGRLTPEALSVFQRFQPKKSDAESGWKIERVE